MLNSDWFLGNRAVCHYFNAGDQEHRVKCSRAWRLGALSTFNAGDQEHRVNCSLLRTEAFEDFTWIPMVCSAEDGVADGTPLLWSYDKDAAGFGCNERFCSHGESPIHVCVRGKGVCQETV